MAPTIGFVILSHRPESQLFDKLLTQLHKFEHVRIGVHHDYGQSELSEAFVQKHKIDVVKPHRPTKWGHITKVPATLDVYKMLHEKYPEIEWFITLSTNCYLAKHPQHIEKFLAETQFDGFMAQSLIHKDARPVVRSHYQTMFTRPYLKIPFLTRKGKLYTKVLRKEIDRSKTPFVNDFQPYFGSDWHILNRKVVDYLLSADIYNHPMLPFMAEANSFPDMNASPIEIVIQTFVLNQKQFQIHKDYHRYIDWEGATNWHPNTLSEKDFDKIIQSNALFTRKLNDEKSLKLADMLDAHFANQQN